MKKISRILSSLLALMLVVIMFTACGVDPEIAATQTIENSFIVFESDDAQQIKDAINTGDDSTALDTSKFTEELILLLFENFNYTINSTEVIDDMNVKVNVSITNADMSAVLTEFLNEVTNYAMEHLDEIGDMSDDDMEQLIYELLGKCLEKEDLKTVTVDLDINVKCSDDGVWKIDTNETLVDAILGGFIEASKNMEF